MAGAAMASALMMLLAVEIEVLGPPTTDECPPPAPGGALFRARSGIHGPWARIIFDGPPCIGIGGALWIAGWRERAAGC